MARAPAACAVKVTTSTLVGPAEAPAVGREPSTPDRTHEQRRSGLRHWRIGLRHWRIGTAARLAAFHALVLACILGAVVFALVTSFSSSYESVATADLGSELRQFAHQANQRPRGESLHAFAVQFLEGHPLAPGDAVIVALGPSDLVLSGNSSPLVGQPIVASWVTTAPSTTTVRSLRAGGNEFEVVGAPIRSSGRVVGTYIAAKDLRLFVPVRSRMLLLSIVEAGVALTAGVAGSYLLLRSLLRKVGAMTSLAEEIGSGALDRRLGESDSGDEVADLSRTFDAMLDRLETAMVAQRRLLADVSHQLRTPLTVVRGHLEVLDRSKTSDQGAVHETLEVVLDEVEHMSRLTERLLELGRAMEPELLNVSPVDLSELLRALLESVSVLAPRRFVLPTSPAPSVLADREQLRGALVNLVENAVHATASDGTIALGCVPERGLGSVRLVVEDSGPGIPLAQRSAALQRFARPGARDADGSGLGLAIAKAVALAHGGAIEIDQSPSLGGARVAIVLPWSRVLEVR